MSNKITLATIQFRADAKGANAALESLRQSSKDAHDEANRMREALAKGIKTMKDANGIDFDVAKKFSEMTKQAKNFDQAIRELVKGATALETVVKNIRIGEIEASSRAELKGAINAAEARKRSVRETDPEDLQQQRELNIVIEESRKQLNNLDRDTQKVIETLDKGGTIAQSVLDKEMKGLREILTMIPKGTEEWNKYNQQLQQMETHVTNIRRQEREQASALLSSKDLGKYSEEDIRAAITNAKELLATYKTASPEAKQLADNIVRAEQFLKNYGVEAARQAAREAEQLRLEKELAATMNKRLRDLKNLSADALEETRRYWEAQRNGAAEGTTEFNKAEAALKKIDGYTRSSRRAELTSILGDPSKFGVSEVKAAVQEAERLRDSVQKGIPVWFQYNKMVEQGRAYLDQMAKSEAAERINQQMQNLSTLSASGLQEVKRYWETMVAGAEKGSRELTDYEARLKEVIAEEQSRKTAAQQRSIDLFASRDLGGYSEKEIREAIEAAKQLIQTYETGDARAKTLGEDIVRAEEHLKQYGLEAARTAQREADALEKANKDQQKRIDLMVKQWNETRSTMSESALKNHERFWQQLIDDPKTAAESLDWYRENLAKVQREIEAHRANVVQNEGVAAFGFFERGEDANASADEVKKQADAMKKWRDSLPKQDEADTIDKINEHLQRVGQTTKKAAEELMDFDRAKEIALQAGDDIYGKKNPAFMASPEEIQAATKSIEKYREELFKTIKAKRDSGEATDAEEQELKELAKYLKDLKFEQDNFNMSREKMETLMKTPVSAANLDELRAAIKRADAELRRMEGSLDENSDKYKELANDVKNAKGILKEMEGQAKATTSAFDKAWSRLKTYVGLYVGASVAMNKLMGTIGDIHELSDRMGEVGKTTQMTADEVGRLTTNLKKIDTRTGIVQLLELSAAAGQLGLKSEQDIQGFTEAANMLTVALPEMGKEAATEMMRVAIATGEVNKIQKEMQEGTIEGSSATAVAMTKIASTIDRLRASSASAAPEITDFVKRVGAVGAQSGITIDQVAALGSTVSSLGMRIEMSATALSRMIPAIKGNAFELSKAIGVTPETIRNLFDTGRGMEVILMILQRIKDSGMDADSIENMLGMAGMKDIMKDLNQQGARAGIVFSGLSQNVDELRRQLGVAKEAYEENIAIQKEYNRMNETTAAKWERLKNQVEEMFVGDESQRMLGGIIDGLKWLLSLITDNSRAFMYAAIAIGTFKAGLGSMVADGITKLKGLKFSIDSVKKSLLTWPNLWNAIGTVAVFAIMKIVEAATSLGEVSKSMGEVEKQLRKEMATADKLFRSLAKVREEERRAAETAKEQAAAEEKKNKTTEKSTEKTKQLSKETDKLTKSEKDAADQAGKVEDGMKRVNTEGNRSAAIIREINSKYGTYLGYMLSETSSARQLADARELINKKLRETITLKQREAAMSDIEQNYGSKVRKGASSTDDLIAQYFSGNDEAYARVSVAVNEAAQKYAKDSKKFNEEVRKIVTANRKYISQGAKKDFRDAYAQSGRGATDDEIVSSIASNIGVRAEDYRKSVEEYQKQTETAERVFEARTNVLRKESREATVKTLNSVMADWREALGKYKKAEGEEKEKLAVEVYKQQRAYNNLFANNSDYFTNDSRKGTIERSIENMKTYEKGLREVADESIRAVDAAERAETKITNTDFTNGGNGANNPWGTPLGGESTDWKNMTAEQLVNRRKQMNQFVNSIQTDTDVQSVLKEDAALRKAIEKGMSSDMRTVIEWYNTERLKIQDELHARHLTNTGDWLDPKKQRNAHKQFRDEMDAYLHEIDAYYTERKTRIEEAGTDEGLTEAEIRNRTLNNEMEWQQRRAELQKLYSRKQKEVTQEELDAIYYIIAERTGDSESFVKAQIAKTNQFVDSIEKSGEKGAAIVHRWMSQVELDTERSYLKGQQALTKQMRAIEAIIDKERPFNGITKSLQESLSTMDILTGEMRKEYNELMKQGKDMTDFNNRQAQEEMKRTAFLLGEAENAYSTNIDRVMDDMRQKGMTAWADWLSADPKLQEALMAQLRSTYDAIQDAIKKEASQLKKQAEIMWNNILMPDGKTTLKQQTDRVIAQLGLDEGRVKRANSLIGAGQASERVADKLAIQQMKIQLAMQEHYYNLMRKQGQAHVDMLKAQAKAAKERGDTEEATRKTLDAQHAQMSLNLATSKEETELAKQREDIIARTEESQNRLYTELKSWADLMTSSVQGIFEAESAGNREYYNERAKLNLTGKGGPGAGTYIIIEDEGTEDAKAHYEYLDERAALERQHEIELQNARADAWKKVMDDINQKMNDTITDQLNAMLQNQSIDANTQAVIANTEALWASMGQGFSTDFSDASTLNRDAEGFAVDGQGQVISPIAPQESSEDQQLQQGGIAWGWPMTEEDAERIKEYQNALWDNHTEYGITKMQEMNDAVADMPSVVTDPYPTNEAALEKRTEMVKAQAEAQKEVSKDATQAIVNDNQQQQQSTEQTNKKEEASGMALYAKLTQAANLYGAAYQAMSNDNLDASQKFQMIALQAAGQAGMAALTADWSQKTGEVEGSLPVILAKCLGISPIWGSVLFAGLSAVLGGLMGIAASKIAKSKAEIAQVTKTSSAGAGRLSTGMLTYAEGNVNEFTDPASLTPGRHYNVDAADGRTYRAKYTGKNPSTHLTSGPEFHLAGERGREMIIDAGTTRQITMNESEIWHTIQTLSGGGRLRHAQRRGRGVRAFAEGNVDEFEEISEVTDAGSTASGMGGEQMAAFQSSLDRNNELLDRALTEGIHAHFDVYGKGGLIDSYDQGKKTVSRHGEKY